MTTNTATVPPAATHSTEAAQVWRSHTATFTVHWGRAGAVIAVDGEIDAANAVPFTDYVKRCADCCEWLIVDLSDLTFIGTTCFSSLLSISAQCTKARKHLMVIPGPAVSTALRVCDPESRLPLVESLALALADLQRGILPLGAVS